MGFWGSGFRSCTTWEPQSAATPGEYKVAKVVQDFLHLQCGWLRSGLQDLRLYVGHEGLGEGFRAYGSGMTPRKLGLARSCAGCSSVFRLRS